MRRLDNNHRVAAEPPEHERQASNSIHDSARESVSRRFTSVRTFSFTSARTLSFHDLEKGANKYYSKNSLSFGQVVPVDNFDEAGVLSFPDDREDEEANDGLDLEAGENRAADFPDLQKCKSLLKQDLQTTTGTA